MITFYKIHKSLNPAYRDYPVLYLLYKNKYIIVNIFYEKVKGMLTNITKKDAKELYNSIIIYSESKLGKEANICDKYGEYNYKI